MSEVLVWTMYLLTQLPILYPSPRDSSNSEATSLTCQLVCDISFVHGEGSHCCHLAYTR